MDKIKENKLLASVYGIYLINVNVITVSFHILKTHHYTDWDNSQLHVPNRALPIQEIRNSICFDMKNYKWFVFLLIFAISCTPSTSPNDDTDDPEPDPISQKKGFGIGINENNNWKNKLETLNVSWHYSWGNRLPDDHPRGIEYVPMIWGAWGDFSAVDPVIERVNQLAAQGRVKYLLGFNEPDASSQANMTVERALEAWPKLMKADVPLVSPAPVHGYGEWLKSFMEEADSLGYRVDYIGMHWYKGPNVNQFFADLEKVYELYGLPIWLTEFGVADWNAQSPDQNRFSSEQVLTFMREVLPRLEELDYVYRYAWFNSNPAHAPLTTSAIFNLQGELTRLGEFYKAHN